MQSSLSRDTNFVSRVLFVIVSVIIMGLGIWPFLRNYKHSDHHLDFLNHDYGKNLMASAEMGSVFMTEGGDNQVFSTLYFIHAEKIRPDLSPYDQMGNVFKRIYGHMLYVDPRILPRRKNLVDSNIFAGLEPFYVPFTGIDDPRINQDPYFIPYWQGRRPVYLTWQRPQVWTLGDYTYRRYGIMYRVEPIANRLLDDLVIRGSISLDEAGYLFSSWLNRPVDRTYVFQQAQSLAVQGYVRVQGDRIVFVSNTPYPLADYFSRYRLRWQRIPNLRYLDRMAREIPIGFNMQMGGIYRERIRNYQTMYARENRPEVRARIAQEISNAWTETKRVYREAIFYGFDSVSVIGALAALVENEVGEDLSEEAWPHFEHLLTYYYNSRTLIGITMTYNQLLLRTMYRYPDRKTHLLPLLEENVREIRKVIARRSEARLREAPQRDHPTFHSYQEFLQWQQYADMLDAVINGIRTTGVEQLERMANALVSAPDAFPLDQQQGILIQLIQRTQVANYAPYATLAAKIVDVLGRADNLQVALFAWQIAFQIPDWNDKAFTIGDRILVHRDFLTQPIPEVAYNLGILAHQRGDTARARGYMLTFKRLVEGNIQLQARFGQQIRVANSILAQM